jgi:O-antigen ligase
MLGGLVMLGTFSLQMLRLHEVEGSGRLGIWMALLPTSLSSPIVGQGITSMTSVSFRRLGFINQGQNQYLLYLIESGVVGLVFYVALIWSLYRKCSHYISRMPSGIYRDLAVGFKASLLGIYTIAFFESNAVFQNWVWLPAGVFLGASVQYARKSEQANPVNKKC